MQIKLYEWYKQCWAVAVPITGVEIQTAAEQFTDWFSYFTFKVSAGWISRFWNFHGRANRKIHGKSLSTDFVGIPSCQSMINKVNEDSQLESWYSYNTARLDCSGNLCLKEHK
jgi:hypothetical protein